MSDYHFSAQGFQKALTASGQAPLKAQTIETLQVNLGKKCNLRCRHCHVDAGPEKEEMMGGPVLDRVLAVLTDPRIRRLDITGGAPELHPRLGYLIRQAAALGKHILVRSNLLALNLPESRGLAELYREYQVEVVASLPCYTRENVEAQRGEGVFDACISMLRQLNYLGYGREQTLRLNLVYNPLGAFLPGVQGELEADYRQQLSAYGVVFHNLYTIANMPLGRFRQDLINNGQLDEYCRLLSGSFNPATISDLMCLTQLSVGWDGGLYDCDFYQTEDLRLGHISDFDYDQLSRRRIKLSGYCFGCTAGTGSSCCGSLAG